MTKSNNLILDERPLTEYFRDIVKRAVVNTKIEPSLDAEFYIVNLLKEFSKSDKVFEKENNHLLEQPLAVLLERAVHSNFATRLKTLKYLGDISLYFAGYFPMHLNRKCVDVNYYISMGGGAYLTLASCVQNAKSFYDIYNELGMEFRQFVNLLTEVNILCGRKSNNDILKLYEKWLLTGNKRLKKILDSEGIKTDHSDSKQ
jgi:hypothetical protein